MLQLNWWRASLLVLIVVAKCTLVNWTSTTAENRLEVGIYGIYTARFWSEVTVRAASC